MSLMGDSLQTPNMQPPELGLKNTREPRMTLLGSFPESFQITRDLQYGKYNKEFDIERSVENKRLQT